MFKERLARFELNLYMQTMTKFAAFCLVSCNISQNPCIFMYQNIEEKVIHVRGVVPGFVQCTRLSYSKINYDIVIIEGIDTYVYDKTTLR